MLSHEPKAECLAFGCFEVDLATGEIFRNGRRLRLAGQPSLVLVVLLQRAGQLVTREELRLLLWPDETFVDFDHGLNNCINRIREVLGDSAANPRFIETLPKQGYRFSASVGVTPETEPAPSVAPSLPEEPASLAPDCHPAPALLMDKRRKISALRWLLMAGCAIIIVVIGLWIRHGRQHAQTSIHSLAVLPLKNLSGDPAQDYFADGMTEELIGRLSMIRGLRVISRTTAMQFKDTRLSAPEIARTLGVDALVEGSVIRDGNRIRVHAQLIRASTDEHFWSETYDRELGDALTLESDVAQSIARRVEATATGNGRAGPVMARPVSPEAYESYLQGLHAKGNSRAQVEKRIAWFNDAIRKDPTFAPAYVGLADGYEGLGSIFVGASPSETRPQVTSAARKALTLDPELAEAHVSLASMYRIDWKWVDAEAEYKRALDLNPNNAAANLGYSDWLLCQGRMEEALAWASRGRDLDPLGDAGATLAWTLFNARRYGESIAGFRNVLIVKPDDGFSLWHLGWALFLNHQSEEAIRVLENAASVTDRSPGIIGTLSWMYARIGRREDALRLLEELKERQRTGYIPTAAFVHCYLGLGDNDEAFAWLERAYQEHSNILMYLKVFPLFDSVRSDPRFQDLARRVGLS